MVQKQYAGNSTNAPYSTASFEAYGKRDGEYDDYGDTPAPHQDPAQFGGQYGYYTDLETGLLCLTHRYYDPGTGKFLTRDPLGYGGGMNLYGYADGNPVNENDPSGFIPALRGGIPANPEGDEWYPQNWSQARARAIHNWNATLENLATAGDNILQVVQHLDNSECGCSQPAGSVQYRNGYRTPNGKFAKPGGSEPPAGEPQADAVAESIMRKKGFSVVGREVTVNANGLERRYDIVVRGRSGNLIGVEVKSGTASLSKSQKAFDQALNQSGTATVQAVGKYKGLAIRRAIVIRRP